MTDEDSPALDRSTALADYVALDDASYEWSVRRRGQLSGASFVELLLTSQSWRGTVWRHQLFLVRPPQLSSSRHALLWIGGGDWHDRLAAAPSADEPLPEELPHVAHLAAQCQSVGALLMQVPHQPLWGGMDEDDLVAHTFQQFFETGDSTWPLLLPMVKSAVRAMDALGEFSKQQDGLSLEQFTLTGGSKRGWTTWLTSAVDRRVAALAPMVIDMLNMARHAQHQVATWGAFSDQLDDYTARRIPEHTYLPEGRRLRAIVDPLSYRQAIVQPKLILLGANDRYWPLDSLNLYWDQLQGPRHVLYMPNCGHALERGPRLFGALAALHRQAMGGPRLADLNWRARPSAGSIELEIISDPRPRRVQAWLARSATRDFREAPWRSILIEPDGDHFRHAQPMPGSGYLALFGDAEYEMAGASYHLTTTVTIASPQGLVSL